jgi:hypothetical protein
VLVITAHALLAVIAANEHTERPAPTVMAPLEGLPSWVDDLIKLAAE